MTKIQYPQNYFSNFFLLKLFHFLDRLKDQKVNQNVFNVIFNKFPRNKFFSSECHLKFLFIVRDARIFIHRTTFS